MEGIRDKVYIATKTGATTVEGFWADLENSLKELKTDHVDIYQFHNPDFCPKPGDGTGLYEAMLEAKEENHKLRAALDAEMKDRRREISTQEKRINQKEIDQILNIFFLTSEKEKLFVKIYGMLPEGGIFANYDQFCADTPVMNDWFNTYWESQLYSSGLTERDIEL